MRTKHLCVLINTRIKGEVFTVNMFKPFIQFYCTFQGDASFVDPFYYLCFCLPLYIVMSVLSCVVVNCREKADLFTLLCVKFSCVLVTFPYVVSGQIWYLIVSIPELCLLLYF